MASERLSLRRVPPWLVASWALLAAMGLWGFAQRFLSGKELVAYNSYVPWGLWVALYIYLIGLSAGAFLLSSLVYVFRVRSLERLGRAALLTALVTMLSALATIAMDLGHLERAIDVLVSPNFRSMMAWMVWLYSAYFVLLLAELLLAIRDPESRTLRVLAGLGIPLAIAFHGGVGALFGVVGAQPGWNTPLYPLLFLVGALLSGGALLMLIAVVVIGEGRDPGAPSVEILRKTVLGLLLLDLLFVWADLSINLYAAVPVHAEVFRRVLFGEYWYNFWVNTLFFGAALPLFLLLTGRGRPARLAAAGLLISITFLGTRLNLVIPDLVLPQLEGFGEAYRDGRLRFDYFPSAVEWAVAAGVIAAGVLLFALGWRWLPIHPDRGTLVGRGAGVDEIVSRRRSLLTGLGALLGALVVTWGGFKTFRKPRYATGGTAPSPLPPLPVFPSNPNHDEILYRMQKDVARALRKPVEQRRWGMVIDTRKCIGCHACTIACVAENRLPPGVVYRPVLTEQIGTFPNLATRFIPRPCMQCDNPPCVPVCPVQATYMRPDGIVEIDYDKCIGCRYCLAACPYNARTADFGDFHTQDTPELQPYELVPGYEYGKSWDRGRGESPIGNARKCHFCLHRITRGLLPECVTSCVGRATVFGDLNDPESLVSQLAAQPNRMVLLEHLGTKPKVTYLI